MEQMKVRMVGVAPICFHSERLANPTDPFTRELKKLTSQKKKTDDLLEQIKWLEWRAGFYEKDGRVAVPSDNVLATVTNGAKKLRKGRDVSAGVLSKEAFYMLEYEGPQSIEKLKGDERFCDYRSVVVNGKRTMRARPIFYEWALTVALMYDAEIIQESELWQSVEIAGERVGICERRPRWGRYVVERLKN